MVESGNGCVCVCVCFGSALQHGGKCSESLAAWKHFSRSAAAAVDSQKVPTGGGCN